MIKIMGPLLCSFLLLAGCGSGGSGSQVKSDEDSKPIEEIAKYALNFLIDSAEASQLPSGAQIYVTVTGQGIDKTIQVSDIVNGESFEDLPVGDYLITTNVELGGTEIASGSSIFTLSQTNTTFTASVQLIATDLYVVPEIMGPTFSELNGIYDGQATGSACINNDFINSFGSAPVDLTITVAGTTIFIEADIFPDIVIQFNGTISGTESTLNAGGSYQKSDFTSGSWTIDAAYMMSNRSTYLDINLDGDCVGELIMTGLK